MPVELELVNEIRGAEGTGFFDAEYRRIVSIRSELRNWLALGSMRCRRQDRKRRFGL